MRALVYVLLFGGLAVWSLLALGAHGVVAWVGDLTLGQADLFTGHPETVAWIGWVIAVLAGLGGWLVVAVWAVGVVALLVGAWFLRRFAARSG